MSNAAKSENVARQDETVSSDEFRARRQMAEARFWLSLLGIHKSIYGDLNRVLTERTSVSLAKFDAMAQLYRFPEGLTMGALSKLLKVTNGNVSSLVNRLQTDGFATKDVSEDDRRSFFVALTPKGTEAFEAAMKVHKEVISGQLSCLGLSEIQSATAILRKMSAKLQNRESAE